MRAAIDDRIRRALRRAPYVLGAHAVRVVVAVLVAYPFAALASRTLGSWPQGDALAFEPGGLMLSEVIRLHRPALWTLAEQGALLSLVTLPVGVVLATMVMNALASESPRPHAIATRVLRHLRPFAWLYGLYLVGVAATGVVTYAFWSAAQVWLHMVVGARAGDLLSLSIPAGGFAVLVGLTVLQDMARALVVVHEADVVSSVAGAWQRLVQGPTRVLLAFSARSSAGVFLVVTSVHIAIQLGVTSTTRLVLVAVLHQLVLVLLAALRASWHARALAFSMEGAGAPLAEERGVDLVVAPSGSFPAEVEVHDPSTERGPTV